jgi:hypothetical protein
MVALKIHKTRRNIVHRGEKIIQGETFDYEVFLMPYSKSTKPALITRLGNRIQNGKICLDLDEKMATTNIDNNEYSAIGFVKNRNRDDAASGTLQYYDWLETGNPQLWINDLCRISADKGPVSPLQILLTVFDDIAQEYLGDALSDIHLMVSKEAEAAILTNIYTKYGFMTQETTLFDDYIIMRKPLSTTLRKASVSKTLSKKVRAPQSKKKRSKVF